MKEQVLTISQMQELIDMEVDTSNASIYWSVNKVNARGRKSDLMLPFLTFHNTNQVVGLASFEYIPTFTLQDILDILPESIEEDSIGRFDYELRIKKNGVAYESFDALDSKSEPYVFDEYYIEGEQCKTVLDCAFEMLKSLKKLKKI